MSWNERNIRSISGIIHVPPNPCRRGDLIWEGGAAGSDALHITERYTRVDYDTINYEATIEDKKVFTLPFKTSTSMMLREGQRLREYICPENNEDVLRLEKLLDNPELFKRNPAAPKP